MVRVTEELALSPEHVTLYYTTDPLLGHLPVLIFHGPSTTANYTFNSSRVQVHIYSPAGFQSFPRVTISPNSPFYQVVNYLPREFQVDEVYRALAFGLFKYFSELPEGVKNHIKNQYPTTRGRRPGSSPALFGEQHAADIAKAMIKADNTVEIAQKLQMALQTQHISNVDIDLVLPPGAIVPLQATDLEDVPEDEDDIMDPTLRQYGMYTPLIKLLGEPIFLPTSRLRRAPSKPSALNRTRSFLKDQKIELRRKLAELVDTEERYVMKMNELIKHVADEYRQKAKERKTDSFSPSVEDVEKLFPRSSDRILQVNSAFVQDLRKVMDETEEDALKDMEFGVSMPRAGPSGSFSSRSKDPSGTLAIAKVMLEWFPQFTDCYQDYIRASQNFPHLITSFISQQSSFSQRVASTGEQHLRSTVIEPVQRLPRYSLVIDQIVNCLPITHPALQPMLKARDIIANICSMDDPLADKPHVSNRLRNMVESWPNDLEPKGRLIAAIDFSELPAPFETDAPIDIHTGERAGIFLLFSDCVVLAKKVYGGNMTARDLLREIDKPSAAGLLATMTNAAGGPGSYELAFAGWHDLPSIRFTESADGRLVWMTSSKEMKGAHAGEHVTSRAITSRCFQLEELYESKAAKFTEDVVKARIEGRFSEAEREDPSWTLRSVRMPDTGLGLYAAVFQEGLDQLVEGRKEPAPIRIVVDHEKGTKGSPVGHYGVEIVSDVKTGSGDMTKVVVITIGLSGKKSTDETVLEDFLSTLARRLIQLLSTQFNPSNPDLTHALVSFHIKILKGLGATNRTEKTRSFLGTSPVKMLTSFLGGGSTDTLGSPSRSQRTPVTSVFSPPISRSNSSTRETASLYGSAKSKDGIRMGIEDDKPENPLVRLEHTFTGYMASLQARKGNFIGRTLLNRSTVDELSVNDLYNKMIESPFDIEISADVSADVVFVAFEKFVRFAWRDQIGPIMARKALDALQERASKIVPGDFADFVHYLFADMAPQNRRAFTALIKLLADLLDGCGNDGDRGALTVAFAELLVEDDSAHNYINLLDRLVQDCDRIFDGGSGGGFDFSMLQGNSAFDSMNSFTRNAKSQNGSLTSNTSSLRRKLGFDTLLRQNSRDETRPSVWRTLSKHGRHPTTGEASSMSKASAGSVKTSRSKSIDTGSGPNKLRRPGSRDRPPIAGAFDDIVTRPTSSHRLETIEEPVTKSGKKKRRSSLSDLKSLLEAATLEEETLQQPLTDMKPTSEKINSSPRTSMPSRIPVSPTSNTRAPPLKENLTFIDPFNAPAAAPTTPATARSSPPASPRKAHSKGLSSSNIPNLRTSRIARANSDAPYRQTTSPNKSTTGKLRLQSPQKLRERLQTEKQAIEAVDASLQSELSKITADMARVNSSLPRSATTDIRRLSTSMSALESRLPSLVKELSDRQEALQRDMDNTLKATEAKVKAIDQLYKEATAENELLYERFNSELAKILRALKGKSSDKEELMAKVKESSDETARVKKENARLRREMASLRTLVKGAGDAA
ncbi:RhoGEF domain-containing protein [Pseudomassariella vexata]|uniref:RhoGEF domain-containing protein n=1 Tax=Pseudomassariella vexata TaxID=1141098 RepID=A0A1Y2DFU9_9PEZI|nr:RhoGEF domain-containing protein [Pseudomassariella vexata]ORY58173.1 RhoGEF domain-containing protein [Pseudomassariella vexata]